MGYSPLIYALEQSATSRSPARARSTARRTTRTGGRGRAARSTAGAPACRRRRPRATGSARWSRRGTPVAERVFAEGSYLRPQFIQPYRCQNVLIEGVTIVNSPMWEIHPVLCTNVTVRGVNIAHARPEQRRLRPRVVPRRADRGLRLRHRRRLHRDQVAAATTTAAASPCRPRTSIIRGCTMKDGHGGVTIGSEISGGVRNVFVENCTMDSPNLDRALRFKNNAMRGGTLEHIYMRDVHRRPGRRGGALDRPALRGGREGPVHAGRARRRAAQRHEPQEQVRRSTCAAYPKSEISDVRIVDCRFDGVAQGNVTEGVQALTLRNLYDERPRGGRMRRAIRGAGLLALAALAPALHAPGHAGEAPARLHPARRGRPRSPTTRRCRSRTRRRGRVPVRRDAVVAADRASRSCAATRRRTAAGTTRPA